MRRGTRGAGAYRRRDGRPDPYAGYLHGGNTWVSYSAFVLGASMLIFIANFVWSQVFARVPAGPNPWGSKSIEWQLPSPVPIHNFDRIPVFSSDPYGYGETPSPVAVPAVRFTVTPAVAPA